MEHYADASAVRGRVAQHHEALAQLEHAEQQPRTQHNNADDLVRHGEPDHVLHGRGHHQRQEQVEQEELGRVQPPRQNQQHRHVDGHLFSHYYHMGLNVQAACDHAYRFIVFAVVAPGGSSDLRNEAG
jgi:hypothetical protein